MRAALLVACALLSASGRVVQDPAARTGLEADRQACRSGKAALATMMESVFQDFDAAPDPSAVEVLVAVDGRIRELLRGRPTYRPCESDRLLMFDKRWERMGLTIGYWDDLEYTGRLLVAAHRKAPNSPFRAHTLFSTVFGETPPHGLGVMPDIKAAFAYEAEFPDGPFLRDVSRVIADFHKDLFMVLRDELTDFKYKCFAPYITSGSRATQEDRARRVALEYYERLRRLTPADEGLSTIVEQTRTGTVRAWSFCAD